uniref:CCR4-NOT transcription complex subunit 11 n=1 Tax=Rhizophora mucronata TaxID=61149 RepID=A0A2P2L0S5_RHIMU
MASWCGSTLTTVMSLFGITVCVLIQAGEQQLRT